MKKFTLFGSLLIAMLMGLYLTMPRIVNHVKKTQQTETVVHVQEQNIKKTDHQIQIGLLQLMDHPALDEIRQGFYDRLAERGYVDGKNIKIAYQNGQGDQANLKMISDKFVNEHKDYLVGIATPANQALKSASNGKIPLVFGAVSNPIGAGLVDNFERPGQNVTGVSDRPPIEEQMKLIKEIMGDHLRLGILYNSSETNSHANVKKAKQIAIDYGFTIQERTINSTNDLAQVAEQLSSEVDAIWIPNDNTIASAMPTLIQVTDSKRIPVFPVVDNMVRDGGLATIGISQYALGTDTADVLADILDGQSISEHPVVITDKIASYVNLDKARKLDIQLPKTLIDKSKNVSQKGE